MKMKDWLEKMAFKMDADDWKELVKTAKGNDNDKRKTRKTSSRKKSSLLHKKLLEG